MYYFAINPNIKMEQMLCVNCGAIYALPEDVVAEKRKVGGTFYCPNGHSQTFSVTVIDRLRKEKDGLIDEKLALEKELRSASRRIKKLEKPKKRKPK